jgi:hypothetical protein
VFAGHKETTAGFEKPDLFFLGDKAGETDLFGELPGGDAGGERLADIADQDGPEVRELRR